MGKMIGVIGGIVVLVFGVFGFSFFGTDLTDYTDSGLRVASFNGEVFGDAKIRNVGVDYYVDLITEYDLFFLLEIRDADGSSFWEVCDALRGYECLISERSGRSVSKEAVGVFYRVGLNVSGFGDILGTDLTDFTDEEGEVDDFRFNGSVGGILPLGNENVGAFERAPVYLEVNGVSYFVVHLSPENVYREFEALEALVSGDGYQVTGDRTVVIGDMNADCDYYSSGVDFSEEDGWVWVIGDDADTASGFKDCAYDRIIVSSEVEVLGSGVVGIDGMVSDHNLVWARFAR
jgi:hypothetical protein